MSRGSYFWIRQAVIVTALIVALLTSLITVKLTGNIVNVRTGAEQGVYNTSDVDNRLSSKLDFTRVLYDEYANVIKSRLDISREDKFFGGIITSLRSSFGGTASLPLVEIGREYDPILNATNPYITMFSYNFSRLGGHLGPAVNNIITRNSYFYGGNVGIGTKNPTQKLDVNGTIRSQSLVGSGNAYACLDASGNFFRSLTPCDQK